MTFVPCSHVKADQGWQHLLVKDTNCVPREKKQKCCANANLLSTRQDREKVTSSVAGSVRRSGPPPRSRAWISGQL